MEQRKSRVICLIRGGVEVTKLMHDRLTVQDFLQQVKITSHKRETKGKLKYHKISNQIDKLRARVNSSCRWHYFGLLFNTSYYINKSGPIPFFSQYLSHEQANFFVETAWSQLIHIY